MAVFPVKRLSWFKAMRPRVAASVMAVFMLQVIAAGFCMPSAAAAPVETAHEMMMAHCDTGSSAQVSTHQHSGDDEHTCVHCDLPDVNLSVDKDDAHALNHLLNQLALAQLFVAYAPTVASTIARSSPFLLPPVRTSLDTFDLNQRIRV